MSLEKFHLNAASLPSHLACRRQATGAIEMVTRKFWLRERNFSRGIESRELRLLEVSRISCGFELSRERSLRSARGHVRVTNVASAGHYLAVKQLSRKMFARRLSPCQGTNYLRRETGNIWPVRDVYPSRRHFC